MCARTRCKRRNCQGSWQNRPAPRIGRPGLRWTPARVSRGRRTRARCEKPEASGARSLALSLSRSLARTSPWLALSCPPALRGLLPPRGPEGLGRRTRALRVLWPALSLNRDWCRVHKPARPPRPSGRVRQSTRTPDRLHRPTLQLAGLAAGWPACLRGGAPTSGLAVDPFPPRAQQLKPPEGPALYPE